MKIKIKTSLTGEGSSISEVDADGNERLIKNARGAHIHIGVGEVSVMELRVDLWEAAVEGELEAKTFVANKDGQVKQVKRIEYTDGSSDEYV